MGKQIELKGVERPKIKAIEEAAEYYVAIRDRRMNLTEKEVEARTKLLGVMDENKVDSYRYDERVVVVLPSRKVKVKSATEAGDDNDED